MKARSKLEAAKAYIAGNADFVSDLRWEAIERFVDAYFEQTKLTEKSSVSEWEKRNGELNSALDNLTFIHREFQDVMRTGHILFPPRPPKPRKRKAKRKAKAPTLKVVA